MPLATPFPGRATMATHPEETQTILSSGGLTLSNDLPLGRTSAGRPALDVSAFTFTKEGHQENSDPLQSGLHRPRPSSPGRAGEVTLRFPFPVSVSSSPSDPRRSARSARSRPPLAIPTTSSPAEPL